MSADHTSEQPLFKVCRDCLFGFPATTDYFYKDTRTKDSLKTLCKGCYCKRCTNYVKDNPEKRREADRRRYHQSPAKYRAKTQKWRMENPDKVRLQVMHRDKEGQQRWRRNNPEKQRQYDQSYRDKHPERVRERARRYYANNRDRRRENANRWDKEHPERKRNRDQNRTARKAKLIAQLTVVQWEWLLEQSGHCCVYCGRHESEAGMLAQEHTVPIVQGGHYTVTNIRPACKSCNSSKGGRTPEQAGMKMVIIIDVMKQMKPLKMFED